MAACHGVRPQEKRITSRKTDHADHDDNFGVFLTPLFFRASVVAVRALHMLCALHFFTSGLLYAYLPSTNTAINLEFYDLSVPKTRKGLFGVQYEHFEQVYLSREAFQLALQIHQAYELSRFVPRPMLNHVYIALVVIKCWTFPLAYALIPRHLALRRLCYLTSDLVLGLASTIVVPSLLTLSSQVPVTLATALESLDPRYIANIAIRHCHDMEIPPAFQSLPHVMGFKTYNTSIAAWPTSASLTQTTHPAIKFAFFIRTNFSNGELPPGLRSTPFPSRLYDVEFVATNLRVLPDDLDTVWHRQMNLFFELCSDMRHFPPALARLDPLVLTMAGTPVQHLPIALLESSHLYLLNMRNTSITDIDDDWDSSTTALVSLCLEYSLLARVLRWITPEFRKLVNVFAKGTPVCLDVANATLSGLVNCTHHGPNDLAFYPLEIEDDNS
ncbi:hypothetical protein P43SY_009402 [Pythium insidiosum]|uniref:Uncharacterized protein n=1 Tax=Pythium insidiosum TaxID=114742 RepID=A0AAD5Q4X9_PYTIN|nr:hypothetical protein P43SY_009402 [Pythium insidiosum]